MAGKEGFNQNRAHLFSVFGEIFFRGGRRRLSCDTVDG